VVSTLLALGGCTRQHYRFQADRDAYDLVAEKSFDPRWGLSQYDVYMDPRSRYYERYDPDRSPMPVDDPASHQYMHVVDGMKGWPKWHKNGVRPDLENPDWYLRLGELVPLNEKGEVVLTVDSALKLAYVHSPNYQTQVETVYLSALDVSTERFRLDTQFFGSNRTTYAHQGGLSPPRLIRGNGALPALPRLDSNGLSTDTEFELHRRFATAGELVVGFANSFVWEFTSGDANLTTSIANFSLIQPLLRGAGQDIALEQLTIVERGLLANLRAFQQYRQGFYTQVAVGEAGVSGPQRRGGFFGGTGLTGFTGQGAGGLGGVGAATGFGRGGFGGTGGGGTSGAGFAGGGAGTVGGYIGLLQQLQQIRNTQDALALQLRTLELLEAYLDAGVIDLTQVDQFRQNIETERATLLQQENALISSLDVYKTSTLGLPPDLPVVLDDEIIRQFQFVNPLATALQGRIADLQRELGRMPPQPTVKQLQAFTEQLTPLKDDLAARLSEIENDLARMERQAATRRRTMSEAEASLFEKERTVLVDSLADLNKRHEAVGPRLDKLQQELAAGKEKQVESGLVVWLLDLYRLLGEAVLIQARARLESVSVDPIELTPDDAMRTAMVNRLDVMNNRAALVDSWRLIAFNADALQSRLSVLADGNVSTDHDNALSFRAPTASLRMGVQFDPPFTRLLERNNYRQSLIDYERDRRDFIQYIDGVHRSLRQTLRDLEQLRLNLEIQRRAVAISIRRVDLTQEDLNKPVPPPEPGQPAAQLGPTASLNLLTALSDLRNTQNNFMSVWLNYYATRMRLVRDMGIMMLDNEGRWIDQSFSGPDDEGAEELDLPPTVPTEWYELLEVPAAEQPSTGNGDTTLREVSYQEP
jgi:outer membrane protein TolC